MRNRRLLTVTLRPTDKEEWYGSPVYRLHVGDYPTDILVRRKRWSLPAGEMGWQIDTHSGVHYVDTLKEAGDFVEHTLVEGLRIAEKTA